MMNDEQKELENKLTDLIIKYAVSCGIFFTTVDYVARVIILQVTKADNGILANSLIVKAIEAMGYVVKIVVH